jgi:hypothetical protein
MAVQYDDAQEVTKHDRKLWERLGHAVIHTGLLDMPEQHRGKFPFFALWCSHGTKADMGRNM